MSKSTTLRIEPKTVAEALALLPKIQKDPAYMSITLTSAAVLRMAIDKGLKLLEESYK